MSFRYLQIQRIQICRRYKPKLLSFDILGSAINRDYQEIKMQETIGSVGVGSIPRSLHMVLVDDLTDSCKAGDDIIVTGNSFFFNEFMC